MQFRAMQRSFFFCYHKVGSALCAKLAGKLAATFGWQVAAWAGQIKWIDTSKQITTFAHSLIDFDLSAIPHKGVRLIRDPRDILVSGYLYHQRCQERWCVNDCFDLSPPILPPRVPHSQAHRSEEWKRAYLINLGGLSYQQNLLTRDLEDGLRFRDGSLYRLDNRGDVILETRPRYNRREVRALHGRFRRHAETDFATFRPSGSRYSGCHCRRNR